MRLRTIRQSICALLALALVVGPVASAWPQSLPTEESMRAAMVFNFIRFSELPQRTPGERIHICISAGSKAQVDALTALSGRYIAGRALVVTHLPGHVSECNVIYVDIQPRWRAISPQSTGHPTLTIGTYPGFIGDGGMIEVFFEDGSARFNINLAAGRQAGIRFLPQMLGLARNIHE